MLRLLAATLGLTLALPLAALADPSTSPGYTATDQAQFAKLAAGNGTWTCKDTPASQKPDVITAKQAGNWYVWVETGDEPSTTYVRWSHALRAYVQHSIDDSGSSEVYVTTSADPFNGTWTLAYPKNAPMYPYTMSHSGNTIKVKGQFKDPKTGKVMTYTGVCTKT